MSIRSFHSSLLLLSWVALLSNSALAFQTPAIHSLRRHSSSRSLLLRQEHTPQRKSAESLYHPPQQEQDCSDEDSSSKLEMEETTLFSSVSANENEAVPLYSSNNETDWGKELFLSKLQENADLVNSTFAEEKTESFTTARRVLDASQPQASSMEDASLLQTNHKNNNEKVTTVEHWTINPEIVPATAVVSPPTTPEKTIQAPSVKRILQFAIPAIGVWLCGPLLSLIDTSSVGLLSGTSQQAALNPAVAVTDYTALLIAFLYTGTTNLMAAAREQREHDPDASIRTFRGAMQFSSYVGLGLGLVLFLGATPLLQAIIGNDSIGPDVLNAARKYVRIRALGMPAAAILGSAQAACLGMQDIQSPLYVLGVAAVVNFFGDLLFVGSSHAWIGGAAGAAWATVISQYAAVTLFVKWLCHNNNNNNNKRSHDIPKVTAVPVVNLTKSILTVTQGKKSQRLRRALNPKSYFPPKPISKTSDKTQSFSVRGFLSGHLQARDLWKPPTRAIVQNFAEYIVPVTSTQIGRVSGYVAMSHVVSSALGTQSMAAQQILVSLFYCLCPIADSLSLTAQSFLPSITEKRPSQERTQALRQSIVNFLKAGGVFGAVMMTAVSCIPLLSRFFTTDLQVIGLVNSVAPLLILFFATHGIVCAMEGMLLGRKDLSFLGQGYAVFCALVPFCMWRVKRAALSGVANNIGLRSVWKVFVGYQLTRCAVWLLRVFQLQRRTEQEQQQSSTETTRVISATP